MKNYKPVSENAYLVTLDVSSLYTNIPHNDGIDACRYFLEENNNNNHKYQIDCICNLIEVVLKNNFFQFGDKYYLQKMGTAMGSAMAPAYASLFMGKLEKEFLATCDLSPDVWYRFLDDIFMIWTHSLDELHEFIDKINSFHPHIKFTYNISETNVSFLDVNVAIDNHKNLKTSVHVKPTNVHQYVYSSCHPKPCKDSIPYSQAKRYRRIFSDDDEFKNSIHELRDLNLNRNYPPKVVDNAFDQIIHTTQDDTIKCKLSNILLAEINAESSVL